MTSKLLDRASMTVSGTPGTGNITLLNNRSGYQSFAAAGAQNGDVLVLFIEDGSTAWEFGEYTYSSSGPTITRSAANVIASSNSGSPLSLTSAAVVTGGLLSHNLNGQTRPFLGQVATRSYVPLGLGGGTGFMCRTAHVCRDAVTSLQVVYGNWACLMPSGSPYTSPAASNDTGPETAASSNFTIKVYLEKFNPATGTSTFYPVTWSAASTKTFTGGTKQSALSDSVSVSLAVGEIFYLRVLGSTAGSAGGNNLPLTACNAGSALLSGPLLIYVDGNNAAYSVCEGYEVVTSGSATDKTSSNASGAIGVTVNGTGLTYALSGDAISAKSGSLPTTTFNYYPLAIVGMTRKRSFFIGGASVGFGTGDYIGMTGATGSIGGPAGDHGYIARSIGPYFGYICAAVPSDHVRWMISANTGTNSESNYSMRGALAAYCSDIIMDSGLNDTYADYTASIAASGGLDPVTVWGYLTYFWNMSYFSNKRIFHSTICPISYSTDYWATQANQAATSGSINLTTRNANRSILNDMIRTKAPANVRPIEIAALVEQSFGSYKWKTTGDNYGITLDGVHMSSNGNAGVAAAGPLAPQKLAYNF